jgi:hypothetical protein
MFDELYKRHTGCGWKKALPHLLFLVALIGILFHISSHSSRPDLIPYVTAAFNRGQYVISGKVVAGDRTPVVGATVSLCAALDDWWKGKKQRGSTSTDKSGAYKLVFDLPPRGYLLITKPGYEELVSSSSYSDCCAFRRDFILKETTATVKGRVVDEAGNPVSGAVVYASVGGMQMSAIHSIIPSLVTAKTDSQGRYEVHVAPDGNSGIVALHEKFKNSMKELAITEGLEYKVNFNLRKGNFKFMKVRVVDAMGAAIPSARLAESLSHVMETLSSRDENGITKVRLNMDKIKQPIGCTVSAHGYFSRWIVVDPNQSQLNIVLEREAAITGTVRSHVGQPLANVNVYFRDAGKAKTVKTNRLGSFSVPLTDPPAKYFQFSKPGYKVLDLTLDHGTIRDSLMISLESDQIERQEGGGFYGKVLDSWGTPAFAFEISVFPRDSERMISPARRFLSLEGEFSINDLPAGSYRLCPQRQSADRNTYLCPVPNVIEIRKGSMLGPIMLQLQEPDKR